jgi:hypothetical protein
VLNESRNSIWYREEETTDRQSLRFLSRLGSIRQNRRRQSEILIRQIVIDLLSEL